MLDEIKVLVDKAVSEECVRGLKEHGKFVDGHQAYGVIREELEEAENNFDVISKSFRLAWERIKSDDPDIVRKHMRRIKQYAELLACEAVQVAAMCKKYEESFKEG